MAGSCAVGGSLRIGEPAGNFRGTTTGRHDGPRPGLSQPVTIGGRFEPATRSPLTAQQKRGPSREGPSPLLKVVAGAGFEPATSEGGEFYISDIAADRRVPEEIRTDPEMVAECLGGALYEHDWFDQMKAAGFHDPRVVSRRVMQTEAKGEPIVFSSLTVRAFKFSEPLDARCEDYGQFAVYQGNCPGQEARFVFDDHHVFEAHRPSAVCRNTARMISQTRLGKYFKVTAPVKHFGLFPCRPAPTDPPDSSGAPCC